MMHRVRSFLKNCHLQRDSSVLFSPLRQSSTEAPAPFTVSYLINECGISPESAASAIKYFRFQTPDRANLVLQFFKDLGFSSSHISKVIGRRPRLLVSDPEKQFLPRLRFLQSNGFSASDIAQILLKAPETLHSSIEKQLHPNLEFIKTVIPSQEKVIRAVRRSPLLLTCELESYLIPGIKFLKENGVSDLCITRIILLSPLTIMTSQSQLSETVERVKELGMDPKLTTFIVAVQTMRGMSKHKWESKVDAYKKWGWSDELILRAFTKAPWCMQVSEKKITETMDYLVNKMGFDPLLIADRPLLLSFSLNKRTIPRDAVLSALLSKGLIQSRCSVQALMMSNQRFQRKYLEPYRKEAPELLELFQAKILELNDE